MATSIHVGDLYQVPTHIPAKAPRSQARSQQLAQQQWPRLLLLALQWPPASPLRPAVPVQLWTRPPQAGLQWAQLVRAQWQAQLQQQVRLPLAQQQAQLLQQSRQQRARVQRAQVQLLQAGVPWQRVPAMLRQLLQLHAEARSHHLQTYSRHGRGGGRVVWDDRQVCGVGSRCCHRSEYFATMLACLLACPPACLFACLRVCLPACLFACLPACTRSNLPSSPSGGTATCVPGAAAEGCCGPFFFCAPTLVSEISAFAFRLILRFETTCWQLRTSTGNYLMQ